MRIRIVTLLLVLVCTSAWSQDLGFVVSKKMLPQLTKKLLKDFHGPKDEVVTVPLETMDIYSSFSVTELTESPGLEIIKQISSFKQYDQMSTHLSLKDPILKAKLSESMDMNIEQINNDEFAIKGYFLIDQLIFKTPKLTFCDHTQEQCLREDRITAQNAYLMVDSNDLRADFEFRLKKESNKLIFSLVNFATNLEDISNQDINLDINGELVLPLIYLEVNGVAQKVDTSGFKKALLKHKKWLAKKILHCTSEYLVDGFAKDITELLSDYPVETHLNYQSNTYDRLFRDKLNVVKKDNEKFLERKRDRIPLIVRPRVKKDKNFREFFDLMIQTVNLDYTLSDLVSNSESLGASFKTSLKVNNSQLKDYHNAYKVEIKESNQTDNIAFIVTEDLVNNIINLSQETGIFQNFFTFIQSEKGTEISDLKFSFDNKVITLNGKIDIHLKEKSALGAFIERNNNNGIVSIPLKIELIPFLTQNDYGTFIGFKTLNPVFKNDKTLKEYLAKGSESFKEASFLVKNEIVDGILELIQGLTRTKIPTEKPISSKLSVVIDSFKIDQGQIKLDLYFSKRELDLL